MYIMSVRSSYSLMESVEIQLSQSFMPHAAYYCMCGRS